MAESDNNNNNNNNNTNNDLDASASASASASPSIMKIDGSEQDLVLSRSEFLTREEVLRRRSRRIKQLSRCYKDHYWALMEELKIKYRDFYWKYGKSPFKEDEDREDSSRNRTGENHTRKLGLGFEEYENRCAVAGCKAKAMALTRFCHPHILSDSKQKLYKRCTYVIKSAPTGSVECGKPILRSTVPSLCPSHFQKAETYVTRALKKAGLNVSSSSKLSPKLHVIVSEYVRQIQTKRRDAQKATVDKVEIKEEGTS
ncbi:hypothetical protein L1049_019575 [Liquidambar formosana]|uniref:KAT8 regulatory NSL complex subunit 2 n=1 Tax=Liquidambar formosana TaxID=63359 RepID=A0AAP0X5D5_LIQFO